IGPIVAAITPVPASTFHRAAAHALLLGHFRVASLAGFGCDDKPLAVSAAGALLQYVTATQPGASLSHVTRMQVSAQGGAMLLDRATQRNLELVRRAVDGQVSGSLLSVLDRTVTPMGARLLREWILRPLTDLAQLAAKIEQAIHPEPPPSVKDGGLIRNGYNADLDDLRAISRDGKSWIAQIELQERQRTGIDSLKVRYNQVFGYYIEVTKANLSRVPAHYVRKQTLVNAERFITPELKALEDKALGAEDRIRALEYELFDALPQEAAGSAPRFQPLART